MTLLNSLFFVWVAITAALAGLLIYRSILSMKEHDQIYLDQAEHQLEEEQQANLRSLLSLQPYVRALASGSAVLFVVMVGLGIYQTMPGW
jgi:heme exporter protein D